MDEAKARILGRSICVGNKIDFNLEDIPESLRAECPNCLTESAIFSDCPSCGFSLSRDIHCPFLHEAARSCRINGKACLLFYTEYEACPIHFEEIQKSYKKHG